MGRKAVILFGHGSRDPLWRQPIEAVAAGVRASHPELPVHCAYLELDQPDLAGAAAEAVRQGATQVSVLPMFLGMGRHARQDLPALVDGLRKGFPGVEFVLKPAVGEHPLVTELLAKIAAE